MLSGRSQKFLSEVTLVGTDESTSEVVFFRSFKLQEMPGQGESVLQIRKALLGGSPLL